jgi:hypothetical protein
MSSIESRLGKGLVWPASVVLTTECITASVGLRKRTNFTSPRRSIPSKFYAIWNNKKTITGCFLNT